MKGCQLLSRRYYLINLKTCGLLLSYKQKSGVYCRTCSGIFQISAMIFYEKKGPKYNCYSFIISVLISFLACKAWFPSYLLTDPRTGLGIMGLLRLIFYPPPQDQDYRLIHIIGTKPTFHSWLSSDPGKNYSTIGVKTIFLYETLPWSPCK